MIKIALSTALCAVLASASTTMCFKKDQMDPSTIETVALDGGECQGMFSVSDIKSADLSSMSFTIALMVAIRSCLHTSTLLKPDII